MILTILLLGILATSSIGFLFNQVIFSKPVLNFMLMGMSFSATFANMIEEEQLKHIMMYFNPILGLAILIVILNLGMSLDYHLILGAGLFTFIYIVFRALGKYLGAYFGSYITHAPKTVKKYLGLTLLPHSGVSLVFTGIAVSVLIAFDKENANLIQGTIAAAAVINEVIAVIAAKKGFEWAGELKDYNEIEPNKLNPKEELIITIGREYGSGGHEIGKKLANRLGIPFYDQNALKEIAKSVSLDKSFLENYHQNRMGAIYQELSIEVNYDYSLDDQLFKLQSKLITELAKKGSCVIVEECANDILRKRINVLKVFIYASAVIRRKRIEKNYKQDGDILEKMDRQRREYYQFYTKQKYGDVKNYDICLDGGYFSIEECVELISSIYTIKKKGDYKK